MKKSFHLNRWGSNSGATRYFCRIFVRSHDTRRTSGVSSSSNIAVTIQSVLEGDSNAFRSIVKDQGLMVRSFLASQLFHLDEVDDLAQEVFLTALDKLDTFDVDKNFGAWLRGIARHKLYNHFRSVNRRSAAMKRFFEEVQEVLDPELEKSAASDSRISIEALLRCVEKLPDRLKHVVRSGLEGMHADKLADELDTTRGAIYNLHYRANKLLRSCVEAELV